jgi:transcriptional regulator with XRE-family HTH domain
MRFAIPSIPSALAFRQEAYGWTQAKMAEKLGLQTSHYSEILSGKRKLPYEAACRAFRLGVPAKVLLALKNRRTVAA